MLVSLRVTADSSEVVLHTTFGGIQVDILLRRFSYGTINESDRGFNPWMLHPVVSNNCVMHFADILATSRFLTLQS